MSDVNVSEISERFKESRVEEMDETFSFEWYLNECVSDPKIARNANQRLADMFEFYGTEYDEEHGFTRYSIPTDDPVHDRENVFYGDTIHHSIHEFVNTIKSGSRGLGTEDRIKLLLGPVGSGKSHFDWLVRRYFEDYTRREDGRMYTFRWTNLTDVIEDQDRRDDVVKSPMNQDPLLLLPKDERQRVIEQMNENLDAIYTIQNKQSLDPASQFYLDALLEEYDNDFQKVMENHVEVIRLVADENKRQCIETFEPKDKKNQDETELTGDVNYSKMSIYGSSDPRAFDYSGAFCNANRGIFSGEELLKLQREFLYDFLHATQEGTIKPKNNPRVDIDQVLVGRTNMPEYRDKASDEKMEAFNDRTERIDYPYVLEYSAEAKIYEKQLRNADVPDINIEPHSLEMAGLFSVLSRIMEPNSDKISIVQKAQVYNGDTESYADLDETKLRNEAEEFEEGMDGISPRFIANRIAEAVSESVSQGQNYVSPLVLFDLFEDRLDEHASIAEEDLQKYYKYLELVREEYKTRAIDDVQQAIAYDVDEIEKQGEKYVDNVMAYIDDNKVEDEITGRLTEPDESFMRSVEEQLGIQADRSDDFRQEISNWISRRAREDKSFKPQDNQRLQEALEKKVWDDKKHNINLSALVSQTEDEANNEWIEALKEQGYSEEGATEVLEFAGAELATEEYDGSD
jgi:serine protein kinase